MFEINFPLNIIKLSKKYQTAAFTSKEDIEGTNSFVEFCHVSALYTSYAKR